MAYDPTGPYLSNNAADIPGHLKLGNRVVMLDIWLKVGGIDPDFYREMVVAACEAEGQPVEVAILNEGHDRDRDATVFFPLDLAPTRRDIQTAIDELLYRRADGEVLPTEAEARADRPKD